MSEWSDSHIRTQSDRRDLRALRDAVAAKAAHANGSSWWGCIEFFDRVETVAPAKVADLLDENVSGLTLAWPGGNLRADRIPDGFWVTVIELADAAGEGAQPCKTRSGRALVWGEARGPQGDGTVFSESRVKSITLPVRAETGAGAEVETTRVAVSDEQTGAWREHAVILGKIVATPAKRSQS